MRISVLIPCHNEEKSIRKCVESCLNQTRKFDEIVVVNDGSTDKSGEILATFGNAIKVITIPKATGNKSHAQERGLKKVTGDIFVATDGDTLLDAGFAQAVEIGMADEKIVALGGYVKSLPYNWLTACRAFEYCVGQNLHKLAQSYINFMFVIPGAAGAFRTKEFKKHIKFDHDTLTEDLDFTYKFHKLGLKIGYTRDAICWTQDPASLSQYINQIRRWYGGGFQCLRKHWTVIKSPAVAFELSLLYVEGMISSFIMFVLPFINFYMGLVAFISYIISCMVFALWFAVKDKRWDLLYVPFIYFFLVLINAYILFEQFGKEMLMNKKNLVWFHPERVEI